MNDSSSNFKEWKLKALTDIWTGDAEGRGDRLIPTGLLGSIRWWFEVLVRGLGGKACDPTSPVRCPDHKKNPTEPGHHCVVCELFGCTGWARKFRLMVLDGPGGVIQSQIKANTEFTLRFIPLRQVRDEEWCLLDLTLRLIAKYGAIGGKTVLKPSNEWGIADLGKEDLEEHNNQVKVKHSRHGLPLRQGDIIKKVGNRDVRTLSDLCSELSGKQHGEPITVVVERNSESQLTCWVGKRHHQDFGLIQYLQGPILECGKDRAALESYVSDRRWRKPPHEYDDDHNQDDHNRCHDFSWASLQNFWCVKDRYLARQNANTSTFNRVIGRPELKRESQQEDSWLAGRRAQRGRQPGESDRPPESKKVFSFKHPEEGGRTFGFVKSGTVSFDEMKERLRQAWSDLKDDKFLTGEKILQSLCTGGNP